MDESKEVRIEKIANGTVIDHMPAGTGLRALEILGAASDAADGRVAVGLNMPSRRLGRKDFIKLADRFLTPAQASRLALLAPDASVSTIRDYAIVKKEKIVLPEWLVGVLACSNPKCISNAEKIPSRLRVTNAATRALECAYCERPQ